MLRKKNKLTDGSVLDGGNDAVPAARGGGKVKPMLLGAGLVLVGALGQRFVLAASPAEVIIAPPVQGGAEMAAGSGAHGVDCSVMGVTAADKPHAKKAAAAVAGGSSDLSSMTVNLADGHYLKVGISLELSEDVAPDEFKPQQAKAADVALNYFSAKTVEDLGSDRLGEIKAELTCMIQAAFATGEKDHEPPVVGVLFREFLTS